MPSKESGEGAPEMDNNESQPEVKNPAESPRKEAAPFIMRARKKFRDAEALENADKLAKLQEEIRSAAEANPEGAGEKSGPTYDTSYEREYDASKEKGGNPFWEEQMVVTNPVSRALDRVLRPVSMGVGSVMEKAKGGLKKLRFWEHPEDEGEKVEKYDALVRAGQATLIDQIKVTSYQEYLDWKSAYRRSGKFKGYHFAVAGVYEKKGKKMELVGLRRYKIIDAQKK